MTFYDKRCQPLHQSDVSRTSYIQRDNYLVGYYYYGGHEKTSEFHEECSDRNVHHPSKCNFPSYPMSLSACNYIPQPQKDNLKKNNPGQTEFMIEPQSKCDLSSMLTSLVEKLPSDQDAPRAKEIRSLLLELANVEMEKYTLELQSDSGYSQSNQTPWCHLSKVDVKHNVSNESEICKKNYDTISHDYDHHNANQSPSTINHLVSSEVGGDQTSGLSYEKETQFISSSLTAFNDSDKHFSKKHDLSQGKIQSEYVEEIKKSPKYHLPLLNSDNLKSDYTQNFNFVRETFHGLPLKETTETNICGAKEKSLKNLNKDINLEDGKHNSEHEFCEKCTVTETHNSHKRHIPKIKGSSVPKDNLQNMRSEKERYLTAKIHAHTVSKSPTSKSLKTVRQNTFKESFERTTTDLECRASERSTSIPIHKSFKRTSCGNASKMKVKSFSQKNVKTNRKEIIEKNDKNKRSRCSFKTKINDSKSEENFSRELLKESFKNSTFKDSVEKPNSSHTYKVDYVKHKKNSKNLKCLSSKKTLKNVGCYNKPLNKRAKKSKNSEQITEKCHFSYSHVYKDLPSNHAKLNKSSHNRKIHSTVPLKRKLSCNSNYEKDCKNILTSAKNRINKTNTSVKMQLLTSFNSKGEQCHHSNSNILKHNLEETDSEDSLNKNSDCALTNRVDHSDRYRLVKNHNKNVSGNKSQISPDHDSKTLLYPKSELPNNDKYLRDLSSKRNLKISQNKVQMKHAIDSTDRLKTNTDLQNTGKMLSHNKCTHETSFETKQVSVNYSDKLKSSVNASKRKGTAHYTNQNQLIDMDKTELKYSSRMPSITEQNPDYRAKGKVDYNSREFRKIKPLISSPYKTLNKNRKTFLINPYHYGLRQTSLGGKRYHNRISNCILNKTYTDEGITFNQPSTYKINEWKSQYYKAKSSHPFSDQYYSNYRAYNYYDNMLYSYPPLRTEDFSMPNIKPMYHTVTNKSETYDSCLCDSARHYMYAYTST